MPSVIKSADLRAMDLTVRAGFEESLSAKSYTPVHPAFATTQQSSSRANLYPLAVDSAAIRRWDSGERVVNGLAVESAQVVNETFELTYGIRRTDLDDDQSGTLQRLISRLRSGATKWLRLEDELVFDVINGNTQALDGVVLFSAAHPVNPVDSGAGVYGNTDSGALTIANIVATRKAMQEMKGADGRPINFDPKILLVPPALEGQARKIVGAESIVYSGTLTDSPETNVWRGSFTVVVSPLLATAFGGNDGYWYLVDASDPEDRAVIYQDRESVEIVTKFNPDDPLVFNNDTLVWGTRARRTAAGGNPRRIFRRTG